MYLVITLLKLIKTRKQIVFSDSLPNVKAEEGDDDNDESRQRAAESDR
jgi:hypothetical protein